MTESNAAGLAASVIVCTRNRAPLLRRCLQSLAADPTVRRFEVIVVDNGSTDETAQVVREASAGHLEIHYLFEEVAGLSVARNTAMGAARGEVLIFTDDDVTVVPGWAGALAAAFVDPAVGAAGGRIVPEWIIAPPEWMLGALAAPATLADYGSEPHDFDQGGPHMIAVPVGQTWRSAVPLYPVRFRMGWATEVCAAWVQKMCS